MKKWLLIGLTLTMTMSLLGCGASSTTMEKDDTSIMPRTAQDTMDSMWDTAKEDTAMSEEKLFRMASFEQMIENAKVHDTDGILTDGENATTPGIAT